MGKNEPEALAATTLAALRIDGDRLWRALMGLAKIGATERGGVRRLALTDLDRAGRDLVVGWCRDAGLAIRIDRVGNIFARPREAWDCRTWTSSAAPATMPCTSRRWRRRR